MNEPQFLDPHAEVALSQNRLPHWQQDNCTYFVTFRLADSVPQPLLDQWAGEREAWLRWHPQPWPPEVEREYLERFARLVEQWLDELHGSCLLRAGDPQRIVAAALQHFEGQRHQQHAWVVMPNHVHTLVSLRNGATLDKLLQSWKGFTAHEINRLNGQHGAFWQKDYFDRLIRNADHFWNCVRYIRHNPVKAHLKPGEYVLYESDYVKSSQ
jgi:REP element-mobilizing transposase RayT